MRKVQGCKHVIWYFAHTPSRNHILKRHVTSPSQGLTSIRGKTLGTRLSTREYIKFIMLNLKQRLRVNRNDIIDINIDVNFKKPVDAPCSFYIFFILSFRPVRLGPSSEKKRLTSIFFPLMMAQVSRAESSE